MLERVTATLQGVQPLLMNNNVGVDSTHPLSMEIKKHTAKRSKTEEDSLEILDLKYRLALYHDDVSGPYIPGNNIHAMLREAGKKRKLGKVVDQSIFVFENVIPLIYDGPRDIEGLMQDRRFRDTRVGRIQKASVVVCRPRFNNWKLTFSLEYDTDLLDRDSIEDLFRIGGSYIGLCDYRPRYGTFATKELIYE